MIRLSTKGRYGTRLMLNLALRYKDGSETVILKNIGDEENISIRYLEQIIIPLKINKLVKSVRGAGGGYALARPPAQINLAEILNALEGSCCLVECVEEAESCERQPSCAAFDVWKDATALLKDYFQNLTLEELCHRSEKKRSKAEAGKKPSKS